MSVQEATSARVEPRIASPDSPRCLLARSLMDLGEFRRAAHVLEAVSEPCDKELFMRLYALYLVRIGAPQCFMVAETGNCWQAGEKRREEDFQESTGAATTPRPACACSRADGAASHDTDGISHAPGGNPMAGELGEELEHARKRRPLDAFGLYLCVRAWRSRARSGTDCSVPPRERGSRYGVVLKAHKRNEEARAALVQSVSAFPWNWSAWLDLASLCTEADAVRASPAVRRSAITTRALLALLTVAYAARRRHSWSRCHCPTPRTHLPSSFARTCCWRCTSAPLRWRCASGWPLPSQLRRFACCRWPWRTTTC